MTSSSHLKPSNKPSPVTALVPCINHTLFFYYCKPSFLKSSLILIAPFKSCLLAKTKKAEFLSSSYFNNLFS